jgi:hypothetical protein
MGRGSGRAIVRYGIRGVMYAHGLGVWVGCPDGVDEGCQCGIVMGRGLGIQIIRQLVACTTGGHSTHMDTHELHGKLDL